MQYFTYYLHKVVDNKSTSSPIELIHNNLSTRLYNFVGINSNDTSEGIIFVFFFSIFCIGHPGSFPLIDNTSKHSKDCLSD